MVSTGPSTVISSIGNCDTTLFSNSTSTGRSSAVRLAQAKQNLKLWPEFPPEILRQGTLSPPDRIKRLLIFSRSLLPVLDGALVVWVLFPLKITDQAGYASLMTQLWRHDYPFPWCHHIRLIQQT